MNFYDTNLNIIQTEKLVSMRGLPLDRPFLASIGILPVEYPYPTYNADTHYMAPDGDPTLNAAGTAYVQAFSVLELSQERQQQNLENKAAQKSSAARSAADEAVTPYLADFSDVEKQTFARQQAEVEAWLADNSAPTPTLDALAVSRGVSRETQIAKAVAKVQAFAPLSAYIVGKQQGYEDQIKAIVADTTRTLAARMAELDALTFDYTLPE